MCQYKHLRQIIWKNREKSTWFSMKTSEKPLLQGFSYNPIDTIIKCTSCEVDLVLITLVQGGFVLEYCAKNNYLPLNHLHAWSNSISILQMGKLNHRMACSKLFFILAVLDNEILKRNSLGEYVALWVLSCSI